MFAECEASTPGEEVRPQRMGNVQPALEWRWLTIFGCVLVAPPEKVNLSTV
jgi:hypothetical protein